MNSFSKKMAILAWVVAGLSIADFAQPQPLGPNLSAAGQPASYTYDKSSGQLQINVTVINNDAGAAGSSSTLGYYLSDDTSILPSDCKLGTDTVPALAPGSTSAETITIGNVCTAGCGTAVTWYIGFIIDETDTVIETNESDNAYYFTPSIDVECGADPYPVPSMTRWGLLLLAALMMIASGMALRRKAG